MKLFTIQDGPIRHGTSGLCLDRGSNDSPVMAICNGSPSQIWVFEKYFPNVKPNPKA